MLHLFSVNSRLVWVQCFSSSPGLYSADSLKYEYWTFRDKHQHFNASTTLNSGGSAHWQLVHCNITQYWSTELRIHWAPSSAWFTWWQQTQYLRQKPFPAFIHSIFRIEENSCDYPFICSSMLLFDLFHCWLAFLHSFTSSVLIVFVQYFSPSKFIHCAICSPCKAFCKKPAIQKTLWINLT